LEESAERLFQPTARARKSSTRRKSEKRNTRFSVGRRAGDAIASGTRRIDTVAFESNQAKAEILQQVFDFGLTGLER
jgi:hypothetical protein